MKTYISPSGTYYENPKSPSSDWIDCGNRPSYWHFFDIDSLTWVENITAREASAKLSATLYVK